MRGLSYLAAVSQLRMERLSSKTEPSRMWGQHRMHPESRRRAKRVAATEVPRIRFHDLRHTHATLLLQAGTNPKVVSERLGHSTVSITLDTYSHVIPSLQEDAAKRASELVFAELG